MCSYNNNTECQVEALLPPPPCLDITLVMEDDNQNSMMMMTSPPCSTTTSCSSDSNDDPRSSSSDLHQTRVRFNETVSVRYSPRTQDLVERVDELWYQSEDRRKTMKRVCAIIKAFQSDDYIPKEGRKLCIRGLEKYMDEAKNIAIERRYEAVKVVLETQSILKSSGITSSCTSNTTTQEQEQEHGVGEGSKDVAETEEEEQQDQNLPKHQYYCSDLLANIYKDTTEECKLEAYQRGVSDAIEIQRMYQLEKFNNVNAMTKTVQVARAG